MLVLDFPLTLTDIFMTQTSYHNTHTYTDPRPLKSTVRPTHHLAMRAAEVVQELKMGHRTASIRSIAGHKCLVAIRVDIRFTSHHICLKSLPLDGIAGAICYYDSDWDFESRY